MRKTKIVATIGPSCMKYDTLKKMSLAGLNVARINLSHAKVDDMNEILKNVRALRKELKIPLPIMLDTRGPEIRVKTFKGGAVEIKRGQTFIFTAREVEGNKNQVSLSEPGIVKNIKAGNKILADDGLLCFKVVGVKGKDVLCKAQNSGVLSNRKSLCLPNVEYNTAYLNDLDKADILWGIKNDADYVAASFVNCKEDVLALREFIVANGGEMKIISKIESARGVANLDEIIEVSDGVMVARGDLGVEMPVERLPDLQKAMIKKANAKGKPVIVATEMLESMITHNRPTRAEVSDVANAVYDRTSAVMLSGETAAGKFPVEAVKTMAKVCLETEKHIDYYKDFIANFESTNSVTDVVSHSAVSASFLQNTKALVVFSSTGLSVNMISRFHPKVSIVGATPNEKVYRQMDLLFGVLPVKTKTYNTTDAMFDLATDIVKAKGLAHVGDSVVVTSGVPKQNGATNLIKIEEVG